MTRTLVSRRAAAVDRALAHHRATGLIRSWRRQDPLQWEVGLVGTADVALSGVREGEIFCSALSSAWHWAARRESQEERLLDNSRPSDRMV